MNKSVFSQNLRRARQLKGWNQQGAAATIGIKQQRLSRFENSEREPNHHTLDRICKAYEIEDLYSFMFNEFHFTPKQSNSDLAA